MAVCYITIKYTIVHNKLYKALCIPLGPALGFLFMICSNRKNRWQLRLLSCELLHVMYNKAHVIFSHMVLVSWFNQQAMLLAKLKLLIKSRKWLHNKYHLEFAFQDFYVREYVVSNRKSREVY